ncbi:metal-dependent hydrolase [Gottfriedia luciferensis]|uniref:metal-dependent hydrolase n=1 Tax=Gottfriedia luciferensis TaxID=178774 RepID=UPI0013026AC0|nr:metal-dependent hydrolase [Gottfriedia luciferensis]
MDGKSHVIVGLFATGITMYATNNDAMTVPLIVGAISSLAPDLDHHNGSLTKKVSMPLKILFSLLFLAVTLFIVIKTGKLIYSGSWIYGISIFLLFIICVSWLRNLKAILMLTGLLIAFIGWFAFYGNWSIIAVGLFIAVSSRLKHRGPTHSLYFLAIWSGICYLLQTDLHTNGLWLAGTVGYFSHLLADQLFTKQRIKWL